MLGNLPVWNHQSHSVAEYQNYIWLENDLVTSILAGNCVVCVIKKGYDLT